MYDYYDMRQPQRSLAWHETLEMHELVAFQSIGLMKIKQSIGQVQCPTLRGIYGMAIESLQMNLKELMPFYQFAPRSDGDDESRELDRAFYAGDLLAFSKTAVRNYAIAITETATPELRKVLARQLQGAIKLHAKVFNYMLSRGYYPAYDLNQLLANDLKLMNKAITMPF